MPWHFANHADDFVRPISVPVRSQRLAERVRVWPVRLCQTFADDGKRRVGREFTCGRKPPGNDLGLQNAEVGVGHRMGMRTAIGGRVRIAKDVSRDGVRHWTEQGLAGDQGDLTHALNLAEAIKHGSHVSRPRRRV
jgi:hypothetical protein